MKSDMSKSSDGTVSISITIPWPDIQAAYEAILKKASANMEIAGFRKGKAPGHMVNDSVDKTKIYEEAIRELVPKAYTQAVNEHSLRPILMPQIELKHAEEGKDWQIEAKTCEKPHISLGDYASAIKKLKSEKTPQIIVPGKEPKPDEKKGPTVDEVLEALLTSCPVILPKILVENEVTHQLSQLVDQTKKLGLTVEQYLSSTNRTQESIRKEYTDQAVKNLSLEFILESVAEAENISVTDAEIEKVLSSVKTAEERKNLENQRYYLTSLIRRQKTVDTLMR